MPTRRKKWSGDYIIVWTDNDWEFFRCCRCGKRLEDKSSRKTGLGRECAKHAALDEVSGVRRQERAKYRAWLKQASRRTTGD